MEAFVNCNTSGLAVYTQPLNQREVEHLYRRCSFGASKEVIDQSVGRTASELMAGILAEAQAAPLLPVYPWSNWTNDDYPEDDDLRRDLYEGQISELSLDYAKALLANGLRDRMSFFWSNHFVTELRVYNCASFLHEYITCLQRYAIGNFKEFVREVGLTAAMLRYLDGAFNRGDREPNENYARELYELFTLGEGNGYTEEDIVETSKALTGYTDNGGVGCARYAFNPEHFLQGDKTIFGRTGNWGYDDVIDILFEERTNEIARFIIGKLYQYLVHPDISADNPNTAVVIDGLANTLVANNFELALVLNQLLVSEHFFDPESFGVIIKSPVDLFFQFENESALPLTDVMLEQFVGVAAQLGQEFFNPVDVAGWQRDRDWISTQFIIGRWLSMDWFIGQYLQSNPEYLRNLAMELVGPANEGTSNPLIVVEAFVKHFTPKDLLTQEEFQNALDAFTIDDIPVDFYDQDYIDYYIANVDPEFTANPMLMGSWILNISMTVPTQVYVLLSHLSRQPEFQLK